MTGHRKKRSRRRAENNAGMSLIELIIGLAISSVISLMVAQFFSIVVRLNRSSTEISVLQREAQTILAEFEKEIMSSEAVYYTADHGSCLLMAGRDAQDGYTVCFEGAVLYYDREMRKLYADMAYRENGGHSSLFNSVTVKGVVARIAAPEYLVSNKVEDFYCNLDADEDRRINLANRHIEVEGGFTISADLIMQYHESRSYSYHTSAMPREKVEEMVWDDRYDASRNRQ